MAHRSPRVLAALAAISLLVAACSVAASDSAATSTTQTTVPAVSTTLEPSTTSTSIETTPSTQPPPDEKPEPAALEAEILVPDGAGPFPAVVLVHGGGWVAGDPGAIRGLARHLTDAGFLTVNTPYALANFDLPGFPQAVEDVACAVALARSHPDSDGTVAVVGHSAGAHLGALVSLSGDEYVANCPYGTSGAPDRLVGLAGPYDISRAGVVGLLFFGEGPEIAPDIWEAGNPLSLAANADGLNSLIMYGDRDGLVPASFALEFHAALVDGGADSTLELVEGARHADLRDPGVVGDLIVVWLER